MKLFLQFLIYPRGHKPSFYLEKINSSNLANFCVKALGFWALTGLVGEFIIDMRIMSWYLPRQKYSSLRMPSFLKPNFLYRWPAFLFSCQCINQTLCKPSFLKA